MPRRPIVRKHVASPAPAAPKAEQAPQISVTRGAGVLKFDPERPQGSFLVLSDSCSVKICIAFYPYRQVAEVCCSQLAHIGFFVHVKLSYPLVI